MHIYESPLGDVRLSDASITERFFEGLEQQAGAPILTDGPTGRTMNAAELTAAIKSLAGGLTERGLGNGHRIALMAPNCPEFAVVFHAAAWAGGAVTTINPTYTAHEAHHQLKDSGAELLVTVPAFLDTAKAAIAGTNVSEIVVLGEAEGATPLQALMGPPLAAQATVDANDHVVALPYSSGTTGLPKGVMLTHRNLVVNIDQIKSGIQIEPGEVTIAFLPFFHIYGLEVLMNAYPACGGRIVTMPRFDLEQFLRLVQEYKVPRLWIAPPVAIALAKHPLVDQFDLSSVKQVMSAAAPLGGEIAEAVGKRLDCIVTQAYGMTELSPATHGVPIDNPRAGSVGLTLAGISCRIVGPDSQTDQPPGKEGELWIKGPQVMKGYLNNPEATASMVDADGWLRTGDIACFDADGHLYIRDRLKELVKYKAFQIAPAELEATLQTHPDIADVAVVGIPDDESGEVPMAFIVAKEGREPTLEEIQEFLVRHLSSYKRVERIAFVEAVPKSASGKILRRVLKEQVAGS